jgi:hypothetical protein
MSRPGNSALAIAAAALAIALVATVTRSVRAGIGRPFGADHTRFLPVAVTPNEAARRVDVTIGGRPFTSYVWPERLKKPVL